MYIFCVTDQYMLVALVELIAFLGAQLFFLEQLLHILLFFFLMFIQPRIYDYLITKISFFYIASLRVQLSDATFKDFSNKKEIGRAHV